MTSFLTIGGALSTTLAFFLMQFAGYDLAAAFSLGLITGYPAIGLLAILLDV